MNEPDFYGDKYIKRIRSRLLYKNQNWLAIICGQTGSGKSYSGISLAQMIAGNKGSWYVVLNPVEFMSLITSGNLRRGDVVVFDEAGVGMSSRDWYSAQNKVLGAVLQTFRNLNVAVIFTTPDLSFIDVQARKLFHSYLETAYLDHDAGLAYLKVYDIQVNSRLDKVYYKHPKFNTERGVITLSHLAVPKPDEGLEDYEEKKRAFTKKLNEDALKELRGDNQQKQKPKLDEAALVKRILQDKDKYVKTYQRRTFIDKELIGADFKVGGDIAKRLKKQVEAQLFKTGEGE